MLANCRRGSIALPAKRAIRRPPRLECMARELESTPPARVACLMPRATGVEEEWLDLILLGVQPMLVLHTLQPTLLVVVLE